MCSICRHFNPNYLNVVTKFHTGGTVNPEPYDETAPGRKSEIRGGDKLEDLDFGDPYEDIFWTEGEA